MSTPASPLGPKSQSPPPGLSQQQSQQSQNQIHSPPLPPPPPPPPPHPDLDLAKLHALPSEQQDLFLLTFAAGLVRHTAALAAAGRDPLLTERPRLVRELFTLIRLPAPSPAPARVIRNSIGRCFAVLFGPSPSPSPGSGSGSGSGSSTAAASSTALLETAAELARLLTAGGRDGERARLPAIVAIGELYAATAAGEGLLVGLAGSVCAGLVRAVKHAGGHHAGLRGAAYAALAKVVAGVGAVGGGGSSLDESSAKDIWKSARAAAAADKAHAVQAAACGVLVQLVRTTPYFGTVPDYDALRSTVWKAIDSPSPAVRHAAAAALAVILVQAFDNARAAAGKSEARLAFRLPDLLQQLSGHYGRSSTSNRARAGIAVCYKLVMRRLGDKVVDQHYPQIAGHLFGSLLIHPTVASNRYRLLMTRKFVRSILEDTVGRQLLHENGQLDAAKWLINGVLKDYPQVIPDRPEPSKPALTAALSALSALICSLGSALTTPLSDACRDALLQLLQLHPSYTVQVHAAHCIRHFVTTCPQQLLICVTICMNTLNREISQLSTPRQSSRRCLGLAHGLAAMLGTARLQPLYGSLDVYSQIFAKATDLLKTSSASELRVAATLIQVAWILIGGLLPLGPSFAKIHLPQLFLLWKNALPKPPLPRDSQRRGPLELSFLAHVRECALGSIFVFLEFNSKLVTPDGARRIATMLQNTLHFLDALPRLKSPEDIYQRLFPSLQLRDFAILVRRRALQCFSKLVHLDHANDVLARSNVLSLAISCFADPDPPDPGITSSLDSSIAGSAAHFDSLWERDDNVGFAVTGYVRETAIEALFGHRRKTAFANWAGAESRFQDIDDVLTSPICHAREHDAILLYSTQAQDRPSALDPPYTGVVNAAIELFAVSLPLQSPKVQESSVEQIATLLSANSLNRNPGRKSAMTVNISVALLYALQVAVKETSFTPGSLKYPATEKIMQELLQTFVINPDPIVRCISSEAIGRLCNSSGNAFTNRQISALVDMIVDNRDSSARAGCAISLGSIHSQVGAMAASFHLKTIVGVLMSLCSDPHPAVHFWALEGLSRVADSAGLTFSAYVSSTLGMLARLYVADTHNESAASVVTSNMETAFPTPVAISRCVDSLINVLGPDLSDMAKPRDLILTLVREFQLEESPALAAESSKCLDHLAFYAPSHLDFAAYVRSLQKELTSLDTPMRVAAIRGLNNLMKRDAYLVMRTAAPTLEDEVWLALDRDPDNRRLRNSLFNLLHQTGLTHTKFWVQRCQRILTKTRLHATEAAPSPPSGAAESAPAPDLPDDEVAGFAAADATERKNSTDEAVAPAQELLRWQTRSFSMNCLSELLAMVDGEMLPDQTISSEVALHETIGDIVKMAFSASTASVVELRIWGLRIFDQILKMFGKTPDPDFTEASLLEQYQAQIGSALTPAFAVDSSPELASAAINVSATFVSSGIVTRVDRMGRIFKILVIGLENFANKKDASQIGDLKGLNSNARVMVKLALFSAWARLHIMTDEQPYLVEIVQPYTAMLTPLWLASLQEYSRLRFEPDISSSLGGVDGSGSLDDIYSALNRETLLRFYQESWLNLVDAIASLVERDSDFVFDALDGKFDPANKSSLAANKSRSEANGNINYRDEPVAFFFVLFGLVFEALVGQTPATPAQKLDLLQALQKILHPSIAGNAVYQEAIFAETVDVLDRMVMTEGLPIQTVIVNIARDLAMHHLQSVLRRDRAADNMLTDDLEQLFELTRIMILVLAGLLPQLRDQSSPQQSNVRGGSGSGGFVTTDEAAGLARLALDSLVEVLAVFPAVIRADLRACILHVFCTVLATGACQEEVVPMVLPILRRFIRSIAPREAAAPSSPEQQQEREDISHQLRGTLARLLAILNVAQRRESGASFPCAKNTLLALTIVLVGAAHMLPAADSMGVVPRALNEMTDCLHDVGLAGVAAGCIRTLLLLPGVEQGGSQDARSQSDDLLARHLFPPLLAFIAHTDGGDAMLTSDPENVRPLVTSTLVAYVTSVVAPASASASTPASPTAAAISLLLPALLARARAEGPPVYPEIAARLADLTALDGGLVRGWVWAAEKGATENGAKGKVGGFVAEVVVGGAGGGKGKGKEGDAGAAASGEEGKKKPMIELRMDF